MILNTKNYEDGSNSYEYTLYLKVMFGDKSNASEGFKYKVGEINVANIWNPNELDPKKMGGFNFSTEDKILRWLVRGDTIYNVTIPNMLKL